MVPEELAVFSFAFLSSYFCEVSIWLLGLSLYFIFYFIFWVAASWKVFVWEGRWEWKKGEVTKPKERRGAKPFLFRIVQCTGFLPKPETKWYSSWCRNGAVPVSQALIWTHLCLGKCRVGESGMTYPFYSLRLSAKAWNSEMYEKSGRDQNWMQMGTWHLLSEGGLSIWVAVLLSWGIKKTGVKPLHSFTKLWNWILNPNFYNMCIYRMYLWASDILICTLNLQGCVDVLFRETIVWYFILNGNVPVIASKKSPDENKWANVGIAKMPSQWDCSPL